MPLSPFWGNLLKRYVKKTFYVGTRKEGFALREDFTEGDYRFFVNGVRKLNLAFTQERQFLPKNYFNQKELRSGYILYFLPVNALKVASLLAQNLDPSFLAKGEMTLLDVGSGPGTGMIGFFLFLENLLRTRPLRIRLRLTFIDQNRQALSDAVELHQEAVAYLNSINPHGKIESVLEAVTGDLFSTRLPQILRPQPVDLIFLLNTLGELHRGKRFPIVEVLLRDYLAPGGRMLLMEPALRLTTRDLMELHDQIVERKSGVVYAPCLHQTACPMLKANNRDWCHTYIPWERPAWIEKIDRLAAIRKDYLKCSYLILGREEVPAVSNETWRVVSGHLNSRGKSELLLCGPGGLPDLLRVTRLDRDRSEANHLFDEVQRGEILRVQKSDRIRKETVFLHVDNK